MMNILRKDTSQSLGSISYALNSEDTETSHYAATALRDELGDFRSNVLKLYKNVKKGEKAEPSQLCEFIEKTYGMICQDENYDLDSVLKRLKEYTTGKVVEKVTCKHKYEVTNGFPT